MDARLLWLALGAFAGSVESSVIVGLLPDMAGETGVSVTEAGLMVFSYSLAYGIGTPLFSTLFGRQHRRRVVVGAEAVFGICALLMAIAPGFPLVLAARTLLACGAGLFTATAQSTAVALAAPGQQGKAISTVVLGGSLAVAFGVPAGTWLGHATSWRVTYALLGILALVAAFTMWRRLPATIEGDPRSLRERLSVLREPGVGRILISSVLGIMGLFIFLVYLASVTTDVIGLSRTLLPVVAFAFGLGALLGNYLAGKSADRMGPWRTQIWILVLTIAALLVVPLITMTPEPLRLWLFLAQSFVYGLVTWGFFPPQLMRLVAVTPGSAILVASVNLSAVNIGGAVAALIGGQVLAGLGAGALAPVTALFALLALVSVWLGPDRPYRRATDKT